MTTQYSKNCLKDKLHQLKSTYYQFSVTSNHIFGTYRKSSYGILFANLSQKSKIFEKSDLIETLC